MRRQSRITAATIAQALGGKPCGGGFIARCPAHDDRIPSLSIADGADGADGVILVFCHAGCAQSDVIAALLQRGLWPARMRGQAIIRNRGLPPPTNRADGKATRNLDFALALFNEAASIDGTPAVRYFKKRGIRIALPSCLRFHPRLKHIPTGQWLPAIVGLITHGQTGRPLGIQRTFLAPGGRSKAQVQPKRMILGKAAEGVIRLAPHTHEVMLCEGIETGLSVMQATGRPVWSALSTSGLRCIQLPLEVAVVTILADGDEAGERAAFEAARRLQNAVRAVRVVRAPPGQDFNDVLTETSQIGAR